MTELSGTASQRHGKKRAETRIRTSFSGKPRRAARIIPGFIGNARLRRRRLAETRNTT